jgi:phage-related protein
MSGTNVGQVYMDLMLNSNQFKKQLKNSVNQSVSSVSKSTSKSVMSAFGKIGKVAAAALSIKAIVNFSKECLDLGSNLAEVQNVVDVTFGDMAGDINEFAKSAIKNIGISETLAKQYTGTIGAMAKSFGFTTAEAANMAKTVTSLTGDVASFYNLDSEEAFTKLKGIFTGETEGLKALGVVMTQSALDQYALSNGYGKTTAKMTEQEKVALRYAFVQSKLSAATGDFIRTQDGWANQTRILSLQFDSFKAAIGQGLINMLTPAIKVVNILMEKLVQLGNVFSSFTEKLFGKSEGSKGTNAISDAVSEIGDLNSGTAAVGDTAAKTAKKIAKSVMGFDQLNTLSDNSSNDSGAAGSGGGVNLGSSIGGDTGIVNNALKETETIFDRIINKVKSFAKIDTIQEWFTTMSGIGSEISTIVSNFIKAVGEVFSVFTGDNAKGIVSSLLKIFSSAFTNVTELAAKWGRDILGLITQPFVDNKADLKKAVDGFLGVVNGVLTNFANSFSRISDNINKVYDEHIKPLLDSFKNGISDSFGKLLKVYNEVVKPTLDRMVEKFNTFWNNTIEPLIIELQALFGDVADLIKGLWETWVKPFIDWIITNVWPKIWPVIEKIWNAVVNVATVIGNKIKSMIEVIRGIIQFLTGVFTGDWTKAWEGVKKIFTGALNNMLATFGTSVEELKTKMTSLKSNLTTKVTSIKTSFSTAFNSIKTTASNTFENIKTTGATKLEAAKTALGEKANAIKTSITSKFTAIKTSVTSTFNGMKTGVINALDALKAGIKTPINNILTSFNKMIDRINKLEFSIPGWVPVVGGKSLGFTIPKIPLLANGGYVKANTPQLSVIGDNRHEGEIVAPESKITESVAAAMGPIVSAIQMLTGALANANPQGGGDITIPIILDGNILDTVIVRASDRKNLRTGGR